MIGTQLKAGHVIIGDPHNQAIDMPITGDAKVDGFGILRLIKNAVKCGHFQIVPSWCLLGNATDETSEIRPIQLGNGLTLENGILDLKVKNDPRMNNARTTIGTSLADGKFIIGNRSGEAEPVNLTGDANLNGQGQLTLRNNVVDFGKMQRISPNKLIGNPSSQTNNQREICLGHGLRFENERLTVYGVCQENDARLSNARTAIGTPLKGILIGINGVATDVAVNGDITCSNGQFQIGTHKVSYNHLQQIAPQSLLGNCESGKTTDATEIKLGDGLLFEEGHLKIDFKRLKEIIHGS